jgi:hypothetical protein
MALAIASRMVAKLSAKWRSGGEQLRVVFQRPLADIDAQVTSILAVRLCRLSRTERASCWIVVRRCDVQP